MRGEYFNAFACERLARYFNQRRCKLPVEPVIFFDEESYLNQGGKVCIDSRKQLLSPLLIRWIQFYGWLNTYILMSISIFVLALPALIYPLKIKPSEVQLLPYGYQEFENYSISHFNNKFKYQLSVLSV